jgi:ubiquinone/menaquinone biosynthesis C-methylase UbiE
MRKTSLGVHKFVLRAAARFRYAFAVASAATTTELKTRVAEFWNTEPCGTRYLEDETSFESHARARYALEPHIPGFAKFASAKGLRVLEIGVGMGADYEQWLRAGANATGVDLSSSSLAQTRRRCELADLKPDLRLADAENLPFEDEVFDVVYSYGVMHHSPDTAQCLREAWRLLKPGGEARIMLYHHRSITGLMLWLRYGIWRAESVQRCVYERLESPGTKTFTKREVAVLMEQFEAVRMDQVFSPGDLLLNKPSARFQSPIYRALWKVFPRGMMRKTARRWGLFLLVTARKPAQ